MGYRKVDKGISFAEGALLRSLEHNCSGEMMERINTVVGWENRAALLREYYPTGQSYEGADRYPPLMVVNGMVLQKWLPIPSDPELGNQIKDRISFKKFPGLPCDKPSPDHAPFSGFRSGLSREAMIAINHELLLQFAHKGLTINEGGAIAVLTNVKPRAMFDALKGMRK